MSTKTSSVRGSNEVSKYWLVVEHTAIAYCSMQQSSELTMIQVLVASKNDNHYRQAQPHDDLVDRREKFSHHSY